MSNFLEDVWVKIGADLSSFVSGMESGQNSVDAFGASLSKIEEGTASLEEFYKSLEQNIAAVGGTAAETTPKVDDLGKKTKETGEAAEHAGEGFGKMREDLLAFGEALAVTEGLKELGVEALTVFGNFQKAQISLEALTGSAAIADSTLQGLKELALSDALSFPALVQAQQRMTAMGFALSAIPGALTGMADAAAATDRDIAGVAGSVERLALTGSASGRILASLGLSVSDLGKTMGVADDQVKAIFKDLDQSDRLLVITGALEKYQGVAEKVAVGILGQWQNVKTQVEFTFEEIGKALEPVVSQLLSLLNQSILPFIRSMVEAFNELSTPVKDAAVAFALLIASLGPAAVALSGFGLAVLGLEAMLPLLATLTGAAEVSFAGVGAAILGATPYVVAIGAALYAVPWKDAISGIEAFVEGFKRGIPGLMDLLKPVLDVVDKIIHVLGMPIPLPGGGGAPKLSVGDSFAIGGAAIGAAWDYVTGGDQSMEKAAANNLSYSRMINDQMAASFDDMGAKHKKTAAEIVADHVAMMDAAKAQKDAAAALAAAYGTLGVLDFPQQVKALDSAYAALKNSGKLSVDELAQAHTNLIDKLQRLSDMVPGVTEEYKAMGPAVAVAFNAVVGQFQQQANEIADVDAAMKQLFIDMLDRAQAPEEAPVVAMVRKLLEGQKELDAAVLKTQANFDKAWESYDKIGQKIRDTQVQVNAELVSGGLATILPKAISDAYDKQILLNQAAKDFGIVIGQSGGEGIKAIRELDSVLGAGNATLENVEIAWAKTQGVINKLGKTDLPLMIEEYGKVISALQAKGASEGQVLQVQEQQLQAIIREKTLRGESATEELLALDKLRDKTEALTFSTQGLGLLYIKLKDDVEQAFMALGKGIADAIVDGKNLGDVFQSIFKQLVRTILEDVIGNAFKQLDIAIKKQIEGIGGLSGALKKIGLGGVGVPGGSGEAPQGGALPTDVAGTNQVGPDVGSGEATGGAATGTGAATTTTGGGSSGLLSSLSQISNVVSAVANVLSGIVQGFQMARLINLTGEIEVTTRKIQNEVSNLRSDEWLREDHLFHKLDDIWNEVRTVTYLLSFLQQLGNAGGGPTGNPLSDFASTVADQSGGMTLDAFVAAGAQLDSASTAIATSSDTFVSTISSTTSSLGELATSVADTATGFQALTRQGTFRNQFGQEVSMASLGGGSFSPLYSSQDIQSMTAKYVSDLTAAQAQQVAASLKIANDQQAVVALIQHGFQVLNQIGYKPSDQLATDASGAAYAAYRAGKISWQDFVDASGAASGINALTPGPSRSYAQPTNIPYQGLQYQNMLQAQNAIMAGPGTFPIGGSGGSGGAYFPTSPTVPVTILVPSPAPRDVIRSFALAMAQQNIRVN